MPGRFGYFMIGGAAILSGMAVQGDLDLDWDDDRHEVVRHESEDRDIDRAVDRIVERETDKIDARDGDGDAERALAAAVAELVRAEGNLITTKLEDNAPAEAIAQAQQRRDQARASVDRLADNVRASDGDRDALRQELRDEIRQEIRDAVRS